MKKEINNRYQNKIAEINGLITSIKAMLNQIELFDYSKSLPNVLERKESTTQSLLTIVKDLELMVDEILLIIQSKGKHKVTYDYLTMDFEQFKQNIGSVMKQIRVD